MMAGTPTEIALCGRLADIGGATIAVAIPSRGLTVTELRQQIARDFARLAEDMAQPRVRFCLGETIVDDDALAFAGQDIAIFPPVSGG